MKRFTLIIALVVTTGCMYGQKDAMTAGLGVGVISQFGGGGGHFTYGVTDKIAFGLDLSMYSYNQFSVKLRLTSVTASALWYPKESLRGFFIGPEFGILRFTFTDPFLTGENISASAMTGGLSLGYTIVAGDKVLITPYAGINALVLPDFFGTGSTESGAYAKAGLRLGLKF